MDKLIYIEQNLESGNIDEAIDALNEFLVGNPLADNAYFLLGKAYWKKGERPKAMAAYSKAVCLNPDSPAALALEHASSVERFFNPDLLNP